ncbi:HD-GYP domain-containing protein [Salimicrobium halophilum]|uniref:HD-GYP domain, c-di-GMP phosphodiesterase class II (Or its inactivated variant) n=1 Tax=Salimicrobium halophilum TaxID=86666 RepID=A0A1G8UPE5_9BACI|nr:HD-GYP domain-containing protein [Salimicrobium halophilum]SDJ55651.1 HD-GYP domain, c-di-GMP phosphodiesterase class II (or its inactivated variant) [Salimicrobium halophilum]
MQINVNELIPGCILTKDVEGKTSRPIIPKDTVIYRTHIDVLQAFRVKEVHISSKMANGENVEEAAKEYEQEQVEVRIDDEFREQYLDGVYKHQQMFKRWRNGFGIDLPAIREWFLPLLFKATATKQEILRLHHYTRQDEYMHHHSVSMGLIAGYLGQRLGLQQGEWIQVALGGLLSDCGMSSLPWDTLHKTGALTERELKEIYQHPVYSYRMVEDLTAMNKKVKLAVLQHHERLDGSGYPLGVRQDKIQFYSQIIAVSDVYHAMTSERPYRKKQSPFKVIEEIQKEQFGKYDLRVTKVLTNDLTNISIGTTVKLSNDEFADIVFIDSATPTHPMVRLHHSDVLISLKDEGLNVKEVY